MKTKSPPAFPGQPAAGNLKPAEIRPLIKAARAAFDQLATHGLIDQGVTFDAWRHAQVREAVGRDGLRACEHRHWRSLMAHFLTLAGRQEAALALRLRTGKVKDHGSPDDTREAREKWCHLMREALAAHRYLAETPLDRILADARAAWETLHPAGPPFAPDSDWLGELEYSKTHLVARGGPITEAYLLTLARHKTRRPNLHLPAGDFWAALADRCTERQLRDLHTTLHHRLATREGRAD